MSTNMSNTVSIKESATPLIDRLGEKAIPTGPKGHKDHPFPTTSDTKQKRFHPYRNIPNNWIEYACNHSDKTFKKRLPHLHNCIKAELHTNRQPPALNQFTLLL